MQRKKRISLWSALAAVSLMVLPAIGAFAAPAAGSGGPSFNDPQSLCKAIVYLPTPGWHHMDGLGWFCVSDLRQYGRGGGNGGLASTFQYSVSGDGYHSATQVQIFFTVNVASTRHSGLKQLSTYAKALSENSAFTISKAMLQNIARGKAFSKGEKTYKVSFKVQHMRKDQYVLQIDKLGKMSGRRDR